MSYWRFAAMIATSTIVMFGLMYLNTYAWGHVLWSETRAWMALLMGAAMATIMLSFMLNMYKSKTVNVAIFAGSAAVFGLSLWIVRSQVIMDGVDYMKAMVPHHSIAILTSERAQITDPRVRKLADEIIEAQRREISEMLYLIEDLEAAESPPASEEGRNRSRGEEALPEVVPAEEALGSPNLSTLDPTTMDEAEIAQVFPAGQQCGFSYTQAGSPILAVAFSGAGVPASGVVKIHGRLVEVRAGRVDDMEALINGARFAANGMQLRLAPVSSDFEEQNGSAVAAAELHFALEQGLEVGYRGWLTCDPSE